MKFISSLLFFVFSLIAFKSAAQLPQTLLLQNGFPMKKGAGYYQNGLLFYNNVGLGLSNHFSMNIGLIPLFLLDEGAPYTISTKYAVQMPHYNLSAALCFFHAGSFDYGWENGITLPYGVLTLGTPHKNVSILAGAYVGYRPLAMRFSYLRNFAKNEENTAPQVFFGLTTQLGKSTRRLSFVMDNYFWKDEYFDYFLVTQPALRISYPRLVVDFSMGFAWDINYFPDAYPLPWVSFFLPFGKR